MTLVICFSANNSLFYRVIQNKQNIMYSEISSYRVFLDSGTQKNRCFTFINLFDKSEDIIGVLQFVDEGLEVKDKKNYDVVHLQYPMSKFPYVLDVLRNEGPVYIGYWENEFGKYGRIYTGKEAVGEGESEVEVQSNANGA